MTINDIREALRQDYPRTVDFTQLVGQKLGVQPQTVAGWLSGRPAPVHSIQLLAILLQELGYNLEN